MAGALPWGSNGVVVRDTLLRLFNQTMASDGMGGAYVFWQDDRSPGIYGQHIVADGRALWTTDGIPIALDPGVDPISWTPDHLGRRFPRCRRSPHPHCRIRLSSAAV